MIRQSITSTDPSLLVQEIRKLEQLQRQLGEEANRALEVLHKEVASHRLGSQATTETVAKMLSEIKDMQVVNYVSEEVVIRDKASLKEEISRLNSQENTVASLDWKLDNVQKPVCRWMETPPLHNDNDNFCQQQRHQQMLIINPHCHHLVEKFPHLSVSCSH